MAITYLEISYPNFVLGSIISPDEANQNNFDLQTKINGIVTDHNLVEEEVIDLGIRKADITLLNSTVGELAGAGRTVETVRQNALNFSTHKTSGDHDSIYYNKTLLNGGQLDSRYYTEAEIDSKLGLIGTGSSSTNLSLANHKVSKDHDVRYYTKEELIPWLRGGDTIIKEETYIIIEPNINGTLFSYSYEGNIYEGYLSEDGGMIFDLKTGFYEINQHRVDVTIDDVLRRSVASGGLVELTQTSILLTYPEDAGTEITVKYFERLGLVAEYNIKMSVEKPPASGGKNMWFKIIG